jgi:hypothetical protein
MHVFDQAYADPPEAPATLQAPGVKARPKGN